MNRTIVVGMMVALVAGCVETRGTRVDIDTESGEAKTVENSYRLAGRVRVVKVTYGDANDGIKRATATLESTTKRRQRIQARMIWMDAEGTEIDADGKAFRTLVVDGADQTTFTGVAPNAKAIRAKLQIRELDTVE